MKKIFKIIGVVLVLLFATIGAGFTGVYFAVRWGLTNTSGVIDKQRENFLNPDKENIPTTTQYWTTLPEWQTIKSAILKDKPAIYRASIVANVSPRIIITQLVVEQLRLFYTERESYKKFFEPLKILGSQTQFSWGVMGIKETTALQIEKNLKDKTTPFYLGADYEKMLDFKTADLEQERFVRMTDQHNHYYSYLYAGLFIKQIEAEWNKAGFDISNRPDVISTLYNIGFKGSKPNPDPKSGGAEIKISEGHTYSFGSLGFEFYNSNELLDEFPRE